MDTKLDIIGGAPLDSLVVDGGPAGLTAALYLARFRRRVLVVGAGDPRALWIPISHNIPLFAAGIGGPEIRARRRASLAPYGVPVLAGDVISLAREGDGVTAEVARRDGRRQRLSTRHAVLGTGAVDVEPPLPDVEGAVRAGCVRHCPICDGHASREQRIGVIGHGARGAAEAIFVACTCSDDVTLLTHGAPMGDFDDATRRQRGELGVRMAKRPVLALERDGERIAAIRAEGGETLRFDVLDSALGLTYGNAFARQLGASLDARGAIVVGEGGETDVRGPHAIGDVAEGLDRIAVAVGQAAVAATRIHNRRGPRMAGER